MSHSRHIFVTFTSRSCPITSDHHRLLAVHRFLSRRCLFFGRCLHCPLPSVPHCRCEPTRLLAESGGGKIRFRGAAPPLARGWAAVPVPKVAPECGRGRKIRTKPPFFFDPRMPIAAAKRTKIKSKNFSVQIVGFFYNLPGPEKRTKFRPARPPCVFFPRIRKNGCRGRNRGRNHWPSSSLFRLRLFRYNRSPPFVPVPTGCLLVPTVRPACPDSARGVPVEPLASFVPIPLAVRTGG